MTNSDTQHREHQLRLVDQLCDGFESAWKAGARPSLGGFLETLDVAMQPAAFDELLAIDIAYRKAGGEQPVAADYAGTYASFATIIDSRFRDDEAETVRGLVPATQLTALPGRRPWPELPGLRILEELGQGGMGIVYLAEQAEPERKVAVKLLAAGPRDEPEARVRFRQEFEATARLGHENIVRVFQVGQHDGQDYCIQEYVSGGNLKDWLRANRLPSSEAATLILILARAVAHAHARGVVHRDLKPANILVEPTGTSAGSQQRLAPSDSANKNSVAGFQPKIADFGLARRLDAAETAHTQTGAVLGTPHYMAPEQAGGGSMAVGPPADVYALGAIFFELLGGLPPHHGLSVIEILERARREEVPRDLIRTAPRDLQTICLKCLAAEPADRYIEAAALVDDLEHFLADRPIKARRASLVERFVRWTRREKRVAALAAVIGLLLVAGLSTLAINRNFQRQQSAARLQSALDELDSGFEFIDREEFAVVPKMDSVRRDFLQRLADKAGALVESDPDVPLLKRQVARIHHQLGVIHELIGQHSLAETAFRRSIQEYRDVLDSQNALPGDRLEHSRFQFRLAKLLERTGRTAQAEELVNDARLGLAHEQIGPETSLFQAIVLRQLGAWEAEKCDPTAAEALLRESLRLHMEPAPVTGYLSVPSATSTLELNQSRVALARFLTARCELVPALALLDEAVTAGERVVTSDPSPVARSGLAQCCQARARARELDGQSERGVSDLVRAHDLFHQLAEEFPLRPEYRIEAGFALQALARHDQRLAGEKTAWQDVDLDEETPPLERRYRQALDLQKQLLADFPVLVDNQRRMAVTLNSLATWLQDKSTYLTDPDQARQARDESLSLHQRAEAIWSRLAQEHSDWSEFHNELARCHQRLGIVLVALGRADEAKAGYQESIDDQLRLATSNPAALAHPFILSALNNNLAVIADQAGDLEEAERLFRLAREHSSAVLARVPRYFNAIILQSNQSMNLVEVLVRRDRLEEAAAEYPRISEDWQPVWWAHRPVFELGRTLITAAQQSPSDGSPPDPDRIHNFERLVLDEVADMIGRADPNTAELPAFLQADPLFDCLRHREEFDDLLQLAAQKFGAKNRP